MLQVSDDYLTKAHHILKELPENIIIPNALPRPEAERLAEAGKKRGLEEPVGGLNFIGWKEIVKPEYAVQSLSGILLEKQGLPARIEEVVKKFFPQARLANVEIYDKENVTEDIYEFIGRNGTRIIIGVERGYRPSDNVVFGGVKHIIISNYNTQVSCVADNGVIKCKICDVYDGHYNCRTRIYNR